MWRQSLMWVMDSLYVLLFALSINAQPEILFTCCNVQEKDRTTCTCIICINIQFMVRALSVHHEAIDSNFKTALKTLLKAREKDTDDVTVYNMKTASLCIKPEGSYFHHSICLNGACEKCGVEGSLPWNTQRSADPLASHHMINIINACSVFQSSIQIVWLHPSIIDCRLHSSRFVKRLLSNRGKKHA